MLQIKNITKTYKTGNLIQKALDDVSLNLRDNEFLAILGPSGSGKTTLLNVIGGLDRYDSGDLIIDGVSTYKYKSRDWDTYRNHTIGFIFQSYNLIPHQSLLANVELALTISGVSKKEKKKRALEALDKVGLKSQAHKLPNQCSGGQMQRVAIARALVNDPKIVLADEPTGALDSKTSIQVMELLKEIAKDKLVVMVTHNPDLANTYANRIVNLIDGKIVNDTNPLKQVDEISTKTKKVRKAHMSYLTALSLSFKNLLSKKGRTILTSFAGSIGIIGIALILSLSTGFQNYVDKIQEDTMSSYPLQIQKDTANLFGALLSTSENEQIETKKEEVKEIQNITSMVDSFGSNDLKSFKNYLDNNYDLYKDDVTRIDYSYSIEPRIYTKDVSKQIVQINPSTILSSLYTDSTSSFLSSFGDSSMMSAFNLADREDIKNKCTLLKGKYPSSYNELLLVLPNDNSISDLLIYSLGLRENKELKTIINQVLSKQVSTINNSPMTLTYTDLLNIDIRLVNPTDLYEYNSTYFTYIDHSEDQDYLNKIYDNFEKLKIVGIATSSDFNGVLYLKDLNDYVIEEAKQSEIVKKQMLNKDINVFSNTRFDEDKKESGINFNDLIQVDEDKITNAFKVNISEDSFKDLLKEDDIKNIVIDSQNTASNTLLQVSSAITSLNKNILEVNINTYEKTNINNLTLSLSAFTTYANMAINKNVYKTMIEAIISQAPTMSNMLELFTDDDYSTLAQIGKLQFLAYYDNLSNKYGNSIDVTLDDNNLVISYGSDPDIINKKEEIDLALNDSESLTLTSNLINKISTNLLPSLVAQGAMSGAVSEASNILKGMGNIFSDDLFSFDKDSFAGAFNFDMDENELSNLMNSMLTNGTATYSSNLTSLGYQDLNDPSGISIYFKDFNSKENFLNLLANYNKNNPEEKIISYTDITGLLMSSVQVIISSVTYVLIAFVSISLVVSSIMIAIITLISVMERTKEIGILRAMGASKHNVSSIFNAETFITGLLSGLLGILVTYSLNPLINNIIHNLTGNPDINATLDIRAAIILVIISVLLTVISGLIPSKKASKQDPAIALRSE